jgi:PIN domain nuclease of toxin-antitoxin system
MGRSILSSIDNDLLLDTHALIWWLVEPTRLPDRALNAIKDRRNTVFVSAATAMEITIKHRLGKLPIVEPFVRDLGFTLLSCGFEPLPIEFEDAGKAGSLTVGHRDPFDRLLIAQALQRNLTLVSNEEIFDITQVHRLWD